MSTPSLVRLDPADLPSWFSARWEGRLPALWSRGNGGLIDRPLAAVIGTRQPGERGLRAAAIWARAVGAAGGVVLSGGAIGIDLQAHHEALASGGATILVPACGLRRYVPPAWYRPLADSHNSWLVTNLQPDEPGSRTAPVLRNRVVAALADVVIVIQSPLRSGTAYVANAMRRRGGPLFVVDFAHDPPPRTEGNRSLLRAGAEPLPERPTRASFARLSRLLAVAHAARPRRGLQPEIFGAEPPASG